MPLLPTLPANAKPDAQDFEDYQTIFAHHPGSAAAPTAGLHFTSTLLAALDRKEVVRENVTLHVGLGTFLPIAASDTTEHRMHAELAILAPDAAIRLNRLHGEGGRIVAVGTTSLRTLESAASPDGIIHPFSDETNIFITPGYHFRATDMLLTNFHLPRSTLFMLVSAFMGLELMKRTYQEAMRPRLSLLFLWRCHHVSAAQGAMSEFRFVKSWPPPELHALAFALHTPARSPSARLRVYAGWHREGPSKAMLPQSVHETGADTLLGNTYHLMLRPGAERIARLGGLHKFMGWEKPILTDSGGFQVMSLASLRKISEEGVKFQSHIDGREEFLSPERAMEIQRLLGSDIQMVLDECPPFGVSETEIEKSLALSMRWAARSKKVAFGDQSGRACFGIVQRRRLPHIYGRVLQKRCRRSDLTVTP